MLDVALIQNRTTGWPGLTIQAAATLDSTQLAATRELATTAPPLVVLAETQTAGIGRTGHTFSSPAAAGLYLSLAFAPPADLPLSLVTPAAGVALQEAIAAVLDVTTQIKWVNDLLWNERKVAGILATAVPAATGGALRVILGVGVNLRPRPAVPLAATALPIGWLQDAQAPDCRATLAAAFLSRLAARLATPADIMPAYRQRAAWLGAAVTLTGAGPVQTGTIAGFANDGSLQLATAAGLVTAATGSIRRR
ncbi:biotin--[acetyl-CoA-carboxylase] ligase [Lacticaseibacillus suihuaensis]